MCCTFMEALGSYLNKMNDYTLCTSSKNIQVRVLYSVWGDTVTETIPCTSHSTLDAHAF